MTEPSPTSFRAPEGEAEHTAFHRSTTLSFRPNGAPSIQRFLDLHDTANHRALFDATGTLTAALVRVPMAHFLAGAPVPTLGIAAVSVPPEHRGTGAATDIMRRAVLEAHADGFPLSTLFASSRALYRKAGFEPAGHLARFQLPLDTIGVRASEPALRPGTPDDHDAIRACYTAVATHTHAALDRPDPLWQRVFLNDDTPREIVVATEGDAPRESITGYLIYHVEQTPGDLRSQSIRVADVAFTNATAGRRLLSYLSRFATLAHEAVIECGPAAPILQLLRENTHRCRILEHWMLRIVNVPLALESRVYPHGLTTTFALDVRDDLVKDNTDRFLVSIETGKARVSRDPGTEAPSASLDVRALAPLYTGFLPPRALRTAGMIDAADATLDAIAPAFAGPPPTVLDFF